MDSFGTACSLPPRGAPPPAEARRGARVATATAGRTPLRVTFFCSSIGSSRGATTRHDAQGSKIAAMACPATRLLLGCALLALLGNQVVQALVQRCLGGRHVAWPAVCEGGGGEGGHSGSIYESYCLQLGDGSEKTRELLDASSAPQVSKAWWPEDAACPLRFIWHVEHRLPHPGNRAAGCAMKTAARPPLGTAATGGPKAAGCYKCGQTGHW